MIKKILWGVGSLVILFACFVIYEIVTTKKHSPPATSEVSTSSYQVKIDYCRPYKNGREIFGQLLPYDTYWRTGANEPTIITFSKEFVFGKELVPAGSYRFYTIPGENEWTIVLNSDIKKWGYFNPDLSLDVARMTVPPLGTNSCVEQFLIVLNEENYGVNLTMTWDFTKVEVPIKI